MNMNLENVLILANGITSSKTLSGGDRRFIALSKRWILSGQNTHIMVPQVGFKLCKKEELNAIYHITSSLKVDRIGVIIPYIIRTIRACMWKIRGSYSTVYSSSDLLCDTLPAVCMKMKKPYVKWVSIIHHIIPSPTKRSGSFLTNFLSFSAQRLSFEIIKRYADLILTYDNNVNKQLLIRLGFPRHKIWVVNNGIDSKYISQIPVPKILYDGSFMGRLQPAKGVFDLIQIWKHIVKKNKNAQLAVIGGGPQKIEGALKKMIKDEGLQKNIHVLGFLPSGAAYRVMKSSKIFVFPSHEEGWGIAICEAMACGLPVVAYDLPVYRGVFKQGIVTVPINDTEEFSEAAVELLEDDERRLELSEKAMAQARKYDWDEVAMLELSLIEKLCAN